MSCESNNWQAKSAFSDLNAISDIIAKEIDSIETAICQVEQGTNEYKSLSVRRVRMEEAFDRICDLAETVNVPENNHEECDDDDCNC